MADNHAGRASFVRGLLATAAASSSWPWSSLNALAATAGLLVPRLLGELVDSHRRRRPGGAQPTPPSRANSRGADRRRARRRAGALHPRREGHLDDASARTCSPPRASTSSAPSCGCRWPRRGRQHRRPGHPGDPRRRHDEPVRCSSACPQAIISRADGRSCRSSRCCCNSVAARACPSSAADRLVAGPGAPLPPARAARATSPRAATYSRINTTLTETVEGARTVEALGLARRRVRAGDDDIAVSGQAERYTMTLRNLLFTVIDVAFNTPARGHAAGRRLRLPAGLGHARPDHDRGALRRGAERARSTGWSARCDRLQVGVASTSPAARHRRGAARTGTPATDRPDGPRPGRRGPALRLPRGARRAARRRPRPRRRRAARDRRARAARASRRSAGCCPASTARAPAR